MKYEVLKDVVKNVVTCDKMEVGEVYRIDGEDLLLLHWIFNFCCCDSTESEKSSDCTYKFLDLKTSKEITLPSLSLKNKVIKKMDAKIIVIE